MIVNGEKYACEACVRGHRVSNCQHQDRPLQHINKKGRPVSQCQHCRAMRKSRSAHIKCDCGEKTTKCAHLQPTVDGHKETCCCNHGGRCSCGGKKEPTLDTVPESDSDAEARRSISGPSRPKVLSRRKRANTVHSDGVMSLDQNGHHKPTTKHSRSAVKTGPYQLNRVNSANSTSSFGTDSPREGSSSRSRAGSSREPRRVKSEATSPFMSDSGFPGLAGNLPPLDLSNIDYPSYTGSHNFELFGTGHPEHDAPIWSAGLSAASVDWSHYDLGEVNGDSFTPSSYSQTGAQSFNGMFDFGSGSEQLPTLAANSGNASEVEDFMPGADGDMLDGFGLKPSNMMGDFNGIDFDSAFKGPDCGPMVGSGASMVDDDPAFFMPNYNNIDGIVEDGSEPLDPGSMAQYWAEM